MSASSDNLRILYPAFKSTTDWPDTTVDTFIGWAAAELDTETWDSFFERGSLALAAHMMEIAKRTSSPISGVVAAAGAVTSIKTDQEQITFGAVGAATAKSSEASLRTTPYGLEYLRLRDERLSATPMYIC